MPKTFSNHEIVTLAVYLLGGESHPVDAEDIAVKANEIAPNRFTWRKYPNQINLESVRKRLWDARKTEKGNYLVGSDKQGWLLTQNGLRFAKEQVRRLDGAELSRKPLGLKEKQWLSRERLRLLGSEAFVRFKTDGLEVVTQQEAEAFFRVDDYVMGEARERKIVRILNLFGDDPELGQAVKKFADKVRQR